MSGSWLKGIRIDDKEYWNYKTVIPERQVPFVSEAVMPSDWRFREDLIWLKYNEMLIAHQWKLRLEVQQRKDRAGRNAAIKKRGKH